MKDKRYTEFNDKNGKPIYEGSEVEHNGLVYKVVFKKGMWIIKSLTWRDDPDGVTRKVPDDLLENEVSALEVVEE